METQQFTVADSSKNDTIMFVTRRQPKSQLVAMEIDQQICLTRLAKGRSSRLASEGGSKGGSGGV